MPQNREPISAAEIKLIVDELSKNPLWETGQSDPFTIFDRIFGEGMDACRVLIVVPTKKDDNRILFMGGVAPKPTDELSVYRVKRALNAILRLPEYDQFTFDLDNETITFSISIVFYADLIIEACDNKRISQFFEECCQRLAELCRAVRPTVDFRGIVGLREFIASKGYTRA